MAQGGIEMKPLLLHVASNARNLRLDGTGLVIDPENVEI
jgi:hypothetical protein